MTRDFYLEHDQPPAPTGWWTNPRLSRPHRGMAWLWRIWLTAWIVAGVVIGLGVVGRATIVGASGDYDNLAQHVPGLQSHVYGVLDASVKQGDYVNIEPSVAWASVAAGHSDADLRRWADALPKGTLVSFSHEPMTEPQLGTPAEFIAAWRHVVTYMRHRHTGFVWVWNVSGNSWTVGHRDPKYAANWWPGNKWVDDVSSESYDYGACHPAGTPHKSFATPLQPAMAFAKAHHMPLVVGEFATNSDHKTRWLKAAGRYVNAHPRIQAAYYYQSPRPAGTCVWKLDTEPEYKALRGMR